MGQGSCLRFSWISFGFFALSPDPVALAASEALLVLKPM